MDTDLEAEAGKFPIKNIPKLLLPKDKFLEVAYTVYKPSIYARFLKSEIKRHLFPELFDEQSSQEPEVLRLSQLCSKVLAQNYKSGHFDSQIPQDNLNFIGENLDVDMPLIDIVELDSTVYWKRVFEAKCLDRKLKCEKLHNLKTDLKKEAIQLKLAEIIETTPYEFWDDDKMYQLSAAVAPYVESLHVSKMMPIKERAIERDPNLVDFKITNYPERECHHGNLDMIGYLTNLTQLEFEFLPPPLIYEYHQRFFFYSYHDFENLARGFKRLTALKYLSIKRSRLDERKLKILVRGLLHLPLEFIEFSYCELNDKAGLCIGKLLQNVNTIKSLELEGNHLGKEGLEPISFAIRSYEGFLEYLGLARNPISDDGIFMLGSGFLGRNQVTHLNLNGIEISPTGAGYVVDMVEIHPKIRKLEICAIPLEEEGGEALIELLKGNKLLYHLECRGCNLTLDQQFKIDLLIKRNKYFFENPALSVEVTSKEMEAETNEWASRVKHPVLLKVNKLLKKRAECLKNRPTPTVFEDTIPFFMHKNALEQKRNTELMGVHFVVENTGDDMEPQPFIQAFPKEARRQSNLKQFDYDPNTFSKKDIARHITVGVPFDPTYNYFPPVDRHHITFKNLPENAKSSLELNTINNDQLPINVPAEE